MAKKKETKVEVEVPQMEEVVVAEEPKVETPKVNVEPQVKRKVKKNPTLSDGWEIKDRTYFLKRQKPLSYYLKSADIYYFDQEKGYERELKYTKNQKTSFVDEMKGDQRLEHIIFRGGVLFVEKEKTVLQKLLSLYHPHRNNLYYEHKPVEVAEDQLDWLEFEIEALSLAKDLDIDLAEAVMRSEMGSKVSNMSSKELRRDLLLFAKKNPKLFLKLASDDNIHLRNIGVKATESGLLNLSSDQRHFTWASTGLKLMTVPFDEHPYTALAHWFKTDEGMEVYSNIEKRMD